MARWNLFASNQCINDPLKTFFALDHLDNELSFNSFVVLDDVWLEFLEATTYLGNYIIGFLLKMDLLVTNQIKRSLDVHDWNCDVELIDHLLDFVLSNKHHKHQKSNKKYIFIN